MKSIDARSISPEAQRGKRIIALNMREHGYIFAKIGDAIGVNARTVQKWSARALADGEHAAIAGQRRGYAVGKPRQLSQAQEADIQCLITDRMPDQLKLPYALWTRKAARDLVEEQTGIKLPIRTMRLYLSRWGFTPQRPTKRDYEQRPAQVQEWLDSTYPSIEQRAKAEDAEIFWGDETGVTSRCQHGRSFVPRGETPVVSLTAKRFGINMISALSDRGALHFMLYKDTFDADRCIEFLERLTKSTSKRKVFLILDNLRVHHALKIKEWVEAKKEKIELFFLPV